MRINASEYPYFVAMDADEVLQADALKNAIQLFFENDDTVAVGDCWVLLTMSSLKMLIQQKHLYQKVGSRNANLGIRRAYMGSRISSDAFNANLNVSSGFGLFKTSCN